MYFGPCPTAEILLCFKWFPSTELLEKWCRVLGFILALHPNRRTKPLPCSAARPWRAGGEADAVAAAAGLAARAPRAGSGSGGLGHLPSVAHFRKILQGKWWHLHCFCLASILNLTPCRSFLTATRNPSALNNTQPCCLLSAAPRYVLLVTSMKRQRDFKSFQSVIPADPYLNIGESSESTHAGQWAAVEGGELNTPTHQAGS